MQFKTSKPEETEALAVTLSLFAKPGLVILLEGNLGAGKSTFARAFIKALALSGADFDVPSPTFTLVQAYDDLRVRVAHVDLYRLGETGDVAELGLAELTQTHLVIIEWPQVAASRLSQHVLRLKFSGAGTIRLIEAEAQGAWVKILQRNGEIETFLLSHSISPTTRTFFEGDASSRRYEKVRRGRDTLILMDMPRRADGPPVKKNKPYSAIAHLAEGLSEVVAINDYLVNVGYSAPRIASCDLDHGLALLEDLGSAVYGQIMRNDVDMSVPMITAVEVLADIAARSWPHTVPLRGFGDYTLPAYDEEAQLIEVDLLPVWFHAHVQGQKGSADLRDSFTSLWREVLHFTHIDNPVWVLRDFHSPNLLWLPEREGLQRVGLIDTQDAVLGHPAYDLAALLQDARVDINFAFADKLYAHYVGLRHRWGAFDEAEFARAFAILGAQRTTKILGIFARLNARDGKPVYLKHMPRVARYLARNLEHPALARIKLWYEREMPEALRVGYT